MAFARPLAEEILQDIRDRTSDIAGIYVEAQKQQEGPPTGKDIQIEIGSDFPDLLPETVEILV